MNFRQHIYWETKYMANPYNKHHAKYRRLVDRWAIFSMILICVAAALLINGLYAGVVLIGEIIAFSALAVFAFFVLLLVIVLVVTSIEALYKWLAGEDF